MAKVTIRINSEVEDEGAPLRDVLQYINKACEGYCSHTHGRLDKMKEYHQKRMREVPILLIEITKMGHKMDKIYNL